MRGKGDQLLSYERVFFAAGVGTVVEDLARQATLKRSAFGYERSADGIAVKVAAELPGLARPGRGRRRSTLQQA